MYVKMIYMNICKIIYSSFPFEVFKYYTFLKFKQAVGKGV